MQLLTKEQPCQVGVQTRLSRKLRLGCAYKHTHLWTLRLLYNFLYSLTHWNLSILKMQSVAFSLLHSDCVCVVSEGLLKLASSSVTIRKPSLKGNISKSLLALPPMPPPRPLPGACLGGAWHTLSRRWTALQGWTGKSFKAFSLSVHLAGWNSSQQKQILPSPKSTWRKDAEQWFYYGGQGRGPSCYTIWHMSYRMWCVRYQSRFILFLIECVCVCACAMSNKQTKRPKEALDA